MNLKSLLQYQQLDIQLKKIMQEIEKSDDFQKIERAKKEFALAKKAVEDSEKNAAGLVEFFDKDKKYADVGQKKLDKLEPLLKKTDAAEGDSNGAEFKVSVSKAEKVKDEDLEKIIAELSQFKKELADLEGKAQERKSKAEDTLKKYKEASEYGRKIKDIHAKVKGRHDEMLKVKQPEIDEIKKKLTAIKPTIEKNILAQYMAITGEGKYPAFVEVSLVDKTNSCRGCGIALSQTGSSNLSERGYTACESCRRVIYKV